MDSKQIIEVLSKWNMWEQEIDDGVKRRHYLSLFKKHLSFPEITALTGVRRGGKSTLLLQVMKELIKNDVNRQNILYVNFEEPLLETNLSLKFLDSVFTAYLSHFKPKGKIYVFFDEIHLLEHWERFVAALYDRKANIKFFVTGSSSKFLQKEVSTLLSGRYLSETIYPLSFAEFLDFKLILKKENALEEQFNEYLRFGGFPRVVLENDTEKKTKLLKEYYGAIVEKDVILRNRARNTREIKDLLLFLMSNIGQTISTYAIEKNLGIDSESGRRYLEYFQEAFLIDLVDFFSYKVKRQIYNPKKVYCIDTGLANSVSFKFSENSGWLLENLVYLQLKRQKKEIYYWKNTTDVDFVIRKGYEAERIYNVVWSLKNPRVFGREMDSLETAKKELGVKNSILLYKEKDDGFNGPELTNILSFLDAHQS